MRIILGLCALALVSAAPALAQTQDPPRGSYERSCTLIQMEGQVLHARCRGPNGLAPTSIDVASCSSDIFVDPDGGLACVGPGGGAPERARHSGYRGGGRGSRPDTVTLSPSRNWGGAPLQIDGPVANLDGSGLNDRVRSIRLERGSRPWVICTDADYGGRCATIYASVSDTRRIGMGDSISSLRPLR